MHVTRREFAKLGALGLAAPDPSHFVAEANHFSNCVQNGLEPKTPGEEGLRDMRLITEIYRSAGLSI